MKVFVLTIDDMIMCVVDLLVGGKPIEIYHL